MEAKTIPNIDEQLAGVIGQKNNLEKKIIEINNQVEAKAREIGREFHKEKKDTLALMNGMQARNNAIKSMSLEGAVLNLQTVLEKIKRYEILQYEAAVKPMRLAIKELKEEIIELKKEAARLESLKIDREEKIKKEIFDERKRKAQAKNKKEFEERRRNAAGKVQNKSVRP